MTTLPRHFRPLYLTPPLLASSTLVRRPRDLLPTPLKPGPDQGRSGHSTSAPRSWSKRRPTYLRVVVTTRCNHRCGYCHMEGDPAGGGERDGLSFSQLTESMRLLSTLGLRKVKFLGGEPLLRKDLPAIVELTRQLLPDADLSVITAGAVPAELQARLFQAGLDRMNVSIHGFGDEEFAARGNPLRLAPKRARFLDALMQQPRPIKLNYVYSREHQRDDLRALLDWAASHPVVVNVLDDLGSDIAPAALVHLVESWYGVAERSRDNDPTSLDTLRLTWRSGLCVEIKDRHLGELAPWQACDGCQLRLRCKEGIFALRLTHDGRVMPCMDRPDLAFPLWTHAQSRGVESTVRALGRWLDDLHGPEIAGGDQAR